MEALHRTTTVNSFLFGPLGIAAFAVGLNYLLTRPVYCGVGGARFCLTRSFIYQNGTSGRVH